MDMLQEFKQYLEEEGKSSNTIKGYIKNVEIYMRWYEDSFGVSFSKLYRNNILDYKSFNQNVLRLDAKTINNKLSALSKFNEYLIEHKYQDEKIIIKSDYMKIQQLIANPCDIDKREVEEFRQKILVNESKRDYAIITILAYAGLRISECLNLNIKDVDLVSKEIRVTGKGNKQRIVFINDKIVNAIKEYLKEKKSDSEYLFVSHKGNRLDRTRINVICNKYSNKITPHKLRHFFCTNALESGGYSTHEVANQAGHTDLRTTGIYTNPSRDKMKEKANKL